MANATIPVIQINEGNVGIGTTSPGAKLHIDSTGNALKFTRASQETYLFEHGTSGLYTKLGTTLLTGWTQDHDFKIYDNTASQYVMFDGSTQRVGIGTTSPGAKLQVNNASTVGSTSANLSGLNPILYLDAGQAAGRSIVLKTHTNGNDTVIGALRFAVSPDGSNYSHASIEAKQDTNGAADTLEFRTSSSNTQGATNNLAMIIQGGNVGIGTTSPDASSLLDVSSTTKGVLLPRMTTTQVNAISSPSNGLTVYNTTLNTLCFYNGTAWQKVTSANM